MENMTVIISLICFLTFSWLLMVSTNGVSDNKSFGRRMTQKDYPIFVYIFIFVLIITGTYLLFFWDV